MEEIVEFPLVCLLKPSILLQAVHIAAQYGQSAFLNHIVAKYHAEFDVPDNDGRTPLHWYVLRLYAIGSRINICFYLKHSLVFVLCIKTNPRLDCMLLL